MMVMLFACLQMFDNALHMFTILKKLLKSLLQVHNVLKSFQMMQTCYNVFCLNWQETDQQGAF